MIRVVRRHPENQFGPDGHLVAPIGTDTVRAAVARKAGARR